MSQTTKIALSVLILGGLAAAKIYLALRPATIATLALGGILFVASTPAKAE